MGDYTVEFRVHVEVGVHQVELHAAYIHTPYVAVDCAAGIRNLYNHGAAVLFHHLLDGELVEVLRFVVGDLLTINAERLCEVAEAVEETDGGHGHAAVGCLFDVVACKYAKTTRVDFQGVAQTVFHREVGNRRDIGAHGLGHVLFERFIDVLYASHHFGVCNHFVQTFG